MKTCAVYARVSTDMQGESLENQVEYAREYIRRLGDEYRLDDTCIYTDFDQSGYYTRFLQRPAIQRALEDAKVRRYDVIVFKEISRISRDQAEHIEIISRFTQHGVRVIAINDNLDSERPETLDLLGIHSVMSELESKRISSRVSSGRKAVARRGIWLGEAPIGYMLNPGTRRLEIDPNYADIPRLIFRLFVDNGYGTFRIAEYLNDRQLLTKNGRLWSRVTVNHVLRNPVYVGDLVYGRTRNTLRRIFDERGYSKVQGRQEMPEEDWVIIRDAHPALVDRATFEKAQTIMTERSRKNPRRTKHPLTGILLCGRCGSGMICQTRRHRATAYRYYTCATAFRYGRRRCEQPNLNAARVEQAVWARIVQELKTYQGLEPRVAYKRNTRDSQSRLKKLEQELRKTRLGLERLLTDTEITESTLAQLKRKFLEKIQSLEREMKVVQSEGREDQECREWGALLAQYIDELEAIDLTDLARARQLFQGVIERIIVSGKEIQEIDLRYQAVGPRLSMMAGSHPWDCLKSTARGPFSSG
jgi:site-specific DNA recombinase